MNSRTKLRAFKLALASAFLVTACGGKPEAGDAGEEEEEATPIPVEVATVQRGDVAAVYSGTAALEADVEAQVVAKVGGEVVSIEVEEGDFVKAGQVLARLDGDRLRLELGQSLANLRKLEQEYERNVDLYDKGLVSSGAYEGLKFELDALRASYRLAQLELSYTEIKAPFDGVIAERHIKVGNTITANTVVFHITDLDPLLAYLHVPEKEFRKLRRDQVAMLSVDALPGQRFAATVARISPVIDSDSGTFKVTLEIMDGNGALKPGMFGRFNIVYDRHEDTLLIPSGALLRDDEETAVFVVKEDVAERRIVTTGYNQGDRLEVTQGLEAGEAIVTVGQAGLSDGNTVRVVNAESAGPEQPDSANAGTPLTSGASGT